MYSSKVVIVTGSSRGIGKAIALEFGRQGATVVVNYLNNKQAAESVVAKIEASGGVGIAYQADVSSPSDVKRLMLDVGEKYGRIDILVNNASVEWCKYIWEISDEDWLSSVHGTLFSTFLTSKYVLPYMIPGKQGKIVNISSIHDTVPRKAASSYCSAKAGVLMLTKVLALELAPYNIQVNAVSPGLTLTDRTGGILSPDGSVDPQNSVVQATPTKRPATVEEVTQAVMYLCGPNTEYTTGTTIYVDGAYRHNLCPERPADGAEAYLEGLLGGLV